MAKRSDFAQKLLDDLRLRKERLASSSQSSNSSNSSMAIIDAYSHAKQNYRGSKHTRPNDMINEPRNGSRAKNWSNMSEKSSSQQIVHYNKNRDLSNKTDSSFSSRTKNFQNYFSPSQIEEISKGIQRLNRILKACSESGVNFDRRSVQIGKELLKGAIDLENSLKLFSVKPEMKNRIKLLGENEDDEDGNGNGNLAKEWELNRPGFSFDKEVEGIGKITGFVQRPKEKKRIPNVIAKLMGLEKLPEENEEEEEEEEESVRIRGGDKEKLAAQAKPFVINTSYVVMVNERPKKIEVKREKKNIESSNSTSRSLKQNSRVTKQKATETISTPQEKLKKNKSLKKCVDSKDELRRFNNNNSNSNNNNNVRKSRNKNELARARSTRQQSSGVREVKPTRREKLGVKGSEPKGQRLGIVKVADEIVVTSPKRPGTLARNDDFSQNVRNDDQLNYETFCEDRELKCCAVADIELDETIDILSSTEPEPNINEKTTSTQTIPEETTTKPAEPTIIILTETENELKQIFLKSQLFLNTAEALFELEIPITTLHSSTTYDININEQMNNNNDDEKLVLDCGYELMRRKGRRQELTVHPNYVVTKQKKIRNSFECLVRELSEDFEKLRVYGRDYGSGAEEYLSGMEESDVAGKEIVMDVNCMWDLGWNETVFAFVEVDEVVKDVEKFLLNYLLDQITTDFYF